MTDLLYGRNAVREALRAGRKVLRLLVAEPAAAPAAPPASGRPGAGSRGGGGSAGRAGTGWGRAAPGRGKDLRGRAGAGRPEERSRPPGVGALRTERRAVTAAARAPLDVIVDLARRLNVSVERVPGERLDKLTNGAGHQGVAAVAESYPYTAWPVLLERIQTAGAAALVLLLDSLQDPQNFGTLLRTAEAVGVTGVVILDHRAVGVTPAVCNASSGAVEYLRVSQVTNLARTVEQLKEAGVWMYALAAAADAQPHTAVDLRGALGLVVGAEGSGVSALVRKRCDGTLALPMHGRIESLNAAVAGSVILYEALRQRGRQ